MISSDPDDTFLVENNIVHKYASRQDIYYLQGYGLFIGRWYGGGAKSETSQYYNEANNVILWADIDTDTNDSHKGYKLYIPDKIKIYMENYKEYSLNVYNKFEIESMGITARGNLIATFNVIYNDDYVTRYNQEHTKDIAASADGIYKITRSDGQTFKLTDKV